MKKYITILNLFLLGSMFMYSQTLENLNALSNKKKIDAAWEYLRGAKTSYNPQRAFQIFLECAKEGDFVAMNAVGKMYITGLGTSKDGKYALEWLTKSANAGYSQAWYNLGMMYKYANGVNQDFTRSYEYFKKSADLGYVDGIFYQGYMLYKGLGCDVNYTLAVGLFKKAASQGNAPSMYFLGLCYRNGFGTNQDTIIGNQWLRSAADGGYKPAKEELTYQEPERALENNRLKSARINDNKLIPSKYKHVKHNAKASMLSGIYKGWLVKYDYSGQYILKQVPLIININVDGKNVTGQWTESDTLIGNFEAIISDTSMVFTKALFKRTDHYHRNQPEPWNFKKANIDLLQTDTSTIMAGNLQMINPMFLEPSKPMYLFLVKSENESGSKKDRSESVNQTGVKDFIAYPNPFSNDVSIQFTLKESTDVNIEVFEIDGHKVFSEKYKNLESGTHLKKLIMQVAVGTYIIKLECNNTVVSSIVIKQ